MPNPKTADDGGPESVSPKPSDAQVSRFELAIAGLSAVVGAVLRFTPASPMWLDEALTVNIASGDLGSIGALLRHDGHPPLYYLLQRLWIDWFGDSDAAVRSLSGVLGVATILATHVVARRLFGRRTAAAAVVVVSLSPYAIRYSSEARMYALVYALVLLGIWLAMRALERPDTGRLVPVAVVSGLLMLTHYWSFFLLGSVFVLLVVNALRAPHAEERRAAGRLAAALAAGGVLFLPWLGGFLDQLAHTGTPWAARPRPTVLVSETLQGMAGGLSPESIILATILGGLAVVAVFTRKRDSEVLLGLSDSATVRRLALVVVATVVSGATVSFLADSAFVARYAAAYLPLILLLVAVGVAGLPSVLARTVTLLLIAGLGFASVAQDMRADRTQAEVIAGAILARAEPGDVVVYCPDQLGPSTARALGDADLTQYTFDQFDDPRLVDWVDYADRHAASDPVAFADELVRRTPPEAALFIVWSNGYRTVDARCSALVDAVAASGDRSLEQLLTGDADNYFENASLHVATPAGAPVDGDDGP